MTYHRSHSNFSKSLVSFIMFWANYDKALEYYATDLCFESSDSSLAILFPLSPTLTCLQAFAQGFLLPPVFFPFPNASYFPLSRKPPLTTHICLDFPCCSLRPSLGPAALRCPSVAGVGLEESDGSLVQGPPLPPRSPSLSTVMDAGQQSLGTDPGSKSLT